MIRVGFIGTVSKEWMGGVNYLKNLLYAISAIENTKIEPIVFMGLKADSEIKSILKEHATVIEHPMFDRKSSSWFMWKIFYKLFGSAIVLERLLKKYQINVLSHSDFTGLKSCKTLNWIPDFQHIHLPHMFSQKELSFRDTYLLKIAKKSDAIVLSSYDALKDFKNFAPMYTDKVDVLQFVSQPENNFFGLTQKDEKKLREKYGLSKNFFYIPNQFWKHKNHMVVFEAIKILKDQGNDVCIVCTGHLNDYRNLDYIEIIKKYIIDNELSEQIHLLGLVDYADVFALIKFSIAVINPSLFEGWSTTVEECKSVGKNMILSDLQVHKEQYQSAVFFDKHNPAVLAAILNDYKATCQNDKNKLELELAKRTKIFGMTYEQAIKKLVDEK